MHMHWCASTDAVVQRQGRSDTYATEFDLEAEEYVPVPKGDVHKKKEVIQDVTLHDLDVANARPQVPHHTTPRHVTSHHTAPHHINHTTSYHHTTPHHMD